jgi:hypothetical protein
MTVEELKEMWKEAFVITLRYYSSICREETSKPANSSKGILHKRRELKLWFSADIHLMKLQRLQNKVLRTIGNLPRRTPVRDLHMAFKICTYMTI